MIDTTEEHATPEAVIGRYCKQITDDRTWVSAQSYAQGLEALLCASGYVIRPVEPTEAMYPADSVWSKLHMRDIYRAMIGAKP